MKTLGILLIGMFIWNFATPVEAQCEGDGDIEYVCGPVNPEDLYAIPDSPWVIVSSMVDGGNLYVTDTRDHSSTVLFSTSTTALTQPDRTLYGACPGPVTNEFRPHGINLREGTNGMHTLYVVGHGARESVEVFEIDARATVPTATWIGCVIAPEGTGLNSVAALPGDGFIATNMQMASGELWEWQPANGWSEVPGTKTAGPNGVEVSANGETIFIGGWGTQSLIRVSRGRTPVQVDSVDVGFHIDNVRFASDGSILAAGHIGATEESLFSCFTDRNCDEIRSRAVRVNPDTLEVNDLINHPSNDKFILGTVALEVGEELWMGGIVENDRIIRFPNKK